MLLLNPEAAGVGSGDSGVGHTSSLGGGEDTVVAAVVMYMSLLAMLFMFSNASIRY